jgi:hypothetical protein
MREVEVQGGAPSRAWRAVAIGAALTVLATAPDVRACGGFFCSQSPVDQTAEHILFTVNDDQTVTAYVQIKYAGDKDDFAWIVPAPGIPTLTADFPDLALTTLDVNTAPRYFDNSCNLAKQAGVTAGANETPIAGSGGVQVVATQVVGPFETTTLEAASADVLVQWLKDNGYRITDQMIPRLQPYVEGGMNFVAVRLQADKDVSDIKPLGMTYDGNKPMIPIRLTAIAAQPEMGIVTWILADRKWAPENYIDLRIPDSLVHLDPTRFGQSNYLTVVSSETDKVGGQAFVTEYARPTDEVAALVDQTATANSSVQEAKDALAPLLRKFAYITRFYARISAEEMTDDPTFMPASRPGDVNNVHDLSKPAATCSFGSPPPTPGRCDFLYCGRRGVCADAEIPENSAMATPAVPVTACACASDATARITTTGAGPALYCEPVREDLSGAGADAEAPLSVAACDGFDCGSHGACVPMNGNPTCQCEGGYAAAISTETDAMGATVASITCRPVTGKVPPLPVLPQIGTMGMPGKTVVAGPHDDGGCTVTSRRRGPSVAALLASLALLAATRRRRVS